MPTYQPARNGVSLSDAFAEAAAVAPIQRVMLWCYELRHPSLAEPARFVNDKNSLLATLESDAPANPGEQVEFLACLLDAERPEESDSAASPEITLTREGVSGILAQAFRAGRGSLEPWELTERVYASDDTSAPAKLPVATYILSANEIGPLTASLKANFADPANISIPRLTFRREQYFGGTVPRESPASIPEPTPGGTTTGTLPVIAFDYSFDMSDARRDLLARFPVVFFGWTRGQIGGLQRALAFMDSISAINPATKFGQYFDLNELFDPLGPSDDRYPYWLQVNSNSLWVRNAAGAKVSWTTGFGNKEINLTLALVASLKSAFDDTYYLSPSGALGALKDRLTWLILDNTWAQPRVDADYLLLGSNQLRTNAAVRAAYMAGHIAYGDALRPLLSGGAKLFANADGTNNGNGLAPAPFAGYYEGALMEGAVDSRAGHTGYTAITGANSLMSNYRSLVANTTEPFSVAFGSYGTSIASHRYAACMAWMDDGAACSEDFSTSSTHYPIWLDEYGVIVGSFTDAFQTGPSSNGVWMRRTALGLVLANPDTGPHTITIAPGYRSFVGTQDPVLNNGALKETITMPAKSGLLLVVAV
jgi:hypothetical protein